MKIIFKWIVMLIFLVIVTILVGGLLVSKHYSFEKRMVINAPQDSVWAHVNTLHEMLGWMPWSKLDPNIQLQFSNTDGEPGSSYSWKGNKDVGEGAMTITSLTPKQKINSQIHFIKPMESKADSYITLTPQGSTTEVVWGMSFDMSYPLNFITKVCFNIDKQMNTDFTSGLNNLKNIAEKKQ